jgi:hypothetical protein
MAIAYNTSIVRNGLVLYLDAANPKSYPGTGTLVKSLVQSNNATLINGVGYNINNQGSFLFDGTNDYAVLTTNIFNTSMPNFTISIWYKNNVSGGMLLGNHFHNSTWESIWFNTNVLIVNGANNNTTNRQTLSFTEPTINLWHNIVAVNNSSLGFMKVYLDGAEYASINAVVIPWNSSVIPTIGAHLRVTTGDIVSPINGNIAQAQIYNRELVAQEVLQNFVATRGRYGV